MSTEAPVPGAAPGARYRAVHRRSIEEPEAFWGEQAGRIDWIRRPAAVLDRSREPFFRWYEGGELNVCANALDRHVAAGRGAQPALVHDSPVSGTQRTLTYAELLDETARFAGALRRLGVGKGDRVVVYMPMVPEAVVAMLACARLGAIHAVVFGGFGAKELATRIDDLEPVVVVSASCGLEPGRVVAYKPLLDEALELATARTVRHCVVLQRPALEASLVSGRDLEWGEALAGAESADPVPVAATDTLYVLHTSGTTANPKGIIHDCGGYAVALHWSMECVYGLGPGDVWWAASDIGWVVGHSYTVYAPLLMGCTTVLYEGKPVGTPDAAAYWRVIAQHRVNAVFTAPTAVRAIRREDPEATLRAGFDLSSLRRFYVAGEKCDAETLAWTQGVVQVPVLDHWWQTETGWPMGANPAGIELLPVKPGSVSVPMPGYDLHVVDDAGELLPPGEAGNVVVRLPLPPGTFPTLWRGDDRFVQSYLAQFPGWYATGDGGYLDEDGYLFLLGRVDDVINVAGHRLSTGALEEALSRHPDVAECAVVGLPDELKGEVPGGFVVLKAGVDRAEADVARELVALVRETVGPVAALKTVAVVPRLPKTRSGKVLRRSIKRLAEGADVAPPPTIEDAGALDDVAEALVRVGLRAPKGE